MTSEHNQQLNESLVVTEHSIEYISLFYSFCEIVSDAFLGASNTGGLLASGQGQSQGQVQGQSVSIKGGQ